MRVEYPILPTYGDNPTEEEKEKTIARYYGHNNHSGFFPIGRMNGWHGGIHIESFDTNIRAIADGRIIAYRLAEDYLTLKDNEKVKYSNSFVLIQHDFETPKNIKFRFFSLYMHLKPKKEILNHEIPNFLATFNVETKDNKEKGLRTRQYCEEDVTKSLETHFIARGEFLKKEKDTTPPKGHWLENNKEYVFALLNAEIIAAFKSCLIDYSDNYYQIDHYKATDNNTIVKKSPTGTMIYNAINGKYIRMEKCNVTLEIEKTKDKRWYKIKNKDEYVLKNDCTSIKKEFKKDTIFNKVKNVDIPIKAGEIIGLPGIYGTEKQSSYTAVHLEVFSDDDKLTNFINNKTDKDRTTYKVSSGKTLQIAKPCNFLKTSTKVKIYQTKGNYTQIGFENLNCITKYSNLIPHTKYNKKTKKNEFTHYTIKEEFFTEINNLLENFLPNNQAKVYFKKDLGTDREIKYKINNAGQKYWVNTYEATGGIGKWITLTADISSYFEKEPTDNTVDIYITQETKIRKKSTTKDANNIEWWKVTAKDQTGWIKKTDLIKQNPYNWTDFGWQIVENTEDKFFYFFGDLVDNSDAHPFVKKIWETIDTNGDEVLSLLELQKAMQNKEKQAKISKLICKHKNEWDTWQNISTFETEIKEIYKKGIEAEETEEQKQKLQEARDNKLTLLKDKIENLCFWDKIKTGDLEPVSKRRAAYIKANKTQTRNMLPTPTEEETCLGNEFDAQEAAREKRYFPSNSKVYHFHPIAFVEQMKLINGTKLEEVLKEMKKLVDKHIPYSQQGERASLSDEGMKELDCSETVGIYLHKLGVMPKYKAIHTGLMTTQVNFRKVIGSNKIEFVEGSDKAGFIPEVGDIFVWRRKKIKKENGKDVVKYDGHTGIVYDYDSDKDVVTILEAIGKWGAKKESKQIANGGDSNKGCTRTAKYGRIDEALYSHKGWVGYFRPIKY